MKYIHGVILTGKIAMLLAVSLRCTSFYTSQKIHQIPGADPGGGLRVLKHPPKQYCLLSTYSLNSDIQLYNTADVSLDELELQARCCASTAADLASSNQATPTIAKVQSSKARACARSFVSTACQS